MKTHERFKYECFYLEFKNKHSSTWYKCFIPISVSVYVIQFQRFIPTRGVVVTDLKNMPNDHKRSTLIPQLIPISDCVIKTQKTLEKGMLLFYCNFCKHPSINETNW